MSVFILNTLAVHPPTKPHEDIALALQVRRAEEALQILPDCKLQGLLWYQVSFALEPAPCYDATVDVLHAAMREYSAVLAGACRASLIQMPRPRRSAMAQTCSGSSADSGVQSPLARPCPT